jgi:Fic family protein
MDLDTLRRSPIGRLVPISGLDGRTGAAYEHVAYLPDPLPHEVTLSPRTWATVVEAAAALGRLDQASRQVPEPALLRRPSLRREAQSTSALEGTFAPLREILESDPDEPAAASAEVREVLNYVAAAEAAFSWITDGRPLTTGLVCGLQGTLVRGTRGELADAGDLRRSQVFIGPRDARIEQARFIPPPPGDQLRAGMEDWIRWVDRPPADMPAVVQAALAHYQFETLHPFSGGNGRIGRLVIVLQLMRQRVLEHPVLVVSPWFEARRVEYQDGLLALSVTGDWDAWVGFFATGVRDAAEDTRQRIVRLLALQARQVEVARAAGVSGVAERVAGELIGAPVLRAGRVADRHGVSAQAAMNALRRLAALGLVAEHRRGAQVLFVAEDVVNQLA